MLWDLNKESTHLNLVVSGSVYTLMNKIFTDSKEPLYGRVDNTIRLEPFSTATLKQIMHDHAPGYANADLLALYAISGCVPKYIELFCDNDALTLETMVDFVASENSPLLDEGRALLVEEFGKNYATYFSILGAIAAGYNTQPQIEDVVGNRSLGGQIRRLIEDYSILQRLRPIHAKEGTHAVKFEIIDPFLRFWFNYIDRYRSLVEMKNFSHLRKLILQDFATFSGKSLERYFMQQLAESGNYMELGTWWEPNKKDNCEIDIVAISITKNVAEAIEVKRNKKEYRSSKLEEKAQRLQQKVLGGYSITPRCLSLDDM
jgi:AAA+ ATPase superfamily predicted ATPase